MSSSQSFLFLYFISILIWWIHVVVMIIRSWNPPIQPVEHWYQRFKGSNNIKSCLYNHHSRSEMLLKIAEEKSSHGNNGGHLKRLVGFFIASNQKPWRYDQPGLKEDHNNDGGNNQKLYQTIEDIKIQENIKEQEDWRRNKD